MKIAILGAESTGKTQLAQSLAKHWTQQGHSALWVPEVLREWCEREGRTPLPHEQLAICQEQAQRVLQAPATDWLVADTTPMMTAIYSDMLFDDVSLYDFALEHQRHYDLTLVMALDLPWVADGLQRDGPHVREPVDRLLRAALARGALPYTVIGGQGEQRTRAALAAISSASMQA
jgi:nicotinamide riboside kinase